MKLYMQESFLIRQPILVSMKAYYDCHYVHHTCCIVALPYLQANKEDIADQDYTLPQQSVKLSPVKHKFFNTLKLTRVVYRPQTILQGEGNRCSLRCGPYTWWLTED